MGYNPLHLPSMKRQWLVNNSNIPNRFLGLDPEDVTNQLGTFSIELEDWLEEVLEGQVIKSVGGIGSTGVGLLFDGTPGLGKTTHAVLALTELIRRLPDDNDKIRQLFGYNISDFGMKSRPVYYMTFADFISRKKQMIDAEPELRRELNLEMEGLHGRSKIDYFNVRVLVLDDLGKEYGSDYTVTGFDEILRSRYDKALPTIITTNTPREQWGRKYGDAMESFSHEAFRRVKLGKKDLRKEQ